MIFVELPILLGMNLESFKMELTWKWKPSFLQTILDNM